MSLPRPRKITVKGRTYHWMVRKAGPDVRLTVQDPATKELHQRTFKAKLDDYGDATVRASVSPADVKEFILYRFPEQPG